MNYNGLKKEFQDEHDHLEYLEEMKRKLENHFTVDYFDDGADHEETSRKTSGSDSQSSTTPFDRDEMEFNFMACFEMEDPVVEDELEPYFKLPQEKAQGCDPVSWWYAKRKTFPRLYRLARDIMTVPGIYFSYYFSIFNCSDIRLS